MRIAVTGATGFVGSHAVRHFSKQGHDILALGRRPASAFEADGNVGYRQWDIRFGPLNPSESVDAVVHCAAQVSDWASPAEFHATNVVGTRNVLQSFAAASTFIYISSASVYDPRQPKTMVRESDTPTNAAYFNAYGPTKLLGEREVGAVPRSAIVLRPHIVYGVGERTLLPRLLRAYRMGRLWLPGNGRNRISLTHVENLMHALDCCLERDFGFEVFNIADAVDDTVDTVVRALLRALNRPPRVQYVPHAVAWQLARTLELLHHGLARREPPLLTRYAISQLVSEYTLDIDRARRRLGYEPRLDYRAGFAELASA